MAKKKNPVLKSLMYVWTTLFTLMLLLILIDAGTFVFFNGWSIIQFISFENGGVANFIRGFGAIVGLLGLINLVIAQIYMILKKF